ncbi:MAG: hypothetical protein ACREO1_11645 [Arenimonas sp.]
MTDISNPNYFPVDFDVAGKEFLMLDLTLEEITQSPFLYSIAGADQSLARRVPEQAFVGLAQPANQAFLFHTAFCGSTLLAQALDNPPMAVSLREPSALLSISHASLRTPIDSLRPSLKTTLNLLGRPWADSGKTLIKPTNQVNRLLPEILKQGPHRAILLYSSLDEFIISCCKKLPAADTQIRWMAQHLLHGTRLQQELGVPTDYKFHFLESCVITWYAQMEWYAFALQNDRHGDVCSLDMNVLMASPEKVVTACANFLQFDTPQAAIAERVGLVFSRNSKDAGVQYSPELRAKERQSKRAAYKRELEVATDWAREAIAPSAIMPTDWKPLSV